jgi:hypothetical protein
VVRRLEGPGKLTPGFSPISPKMIVRRIDGRMAFVPEGQADSSQARSAWVVMQRGPVPEGQSKSRSVKTFLSQVLTTHVKSSLRSVQSSLMIPGFRSSPLAGIEDTGGTPMILWTRRPAGR